MNTEFKVNDITPMKLPTKTLTSLSHNYFDEKEIAKQAKTFGRVDDAGNVYVKTENGEERVGQYAVGDQSKFDAKHADEALNIYVKRYVDIRFLFANFFAHLDNPDSELTTDEIDESIKHLKAAITNLNVVGDLAKIHELMENAEQKATDKKVIIEAENLHAQEQEIIIRERIVNDIESLASENLDRSKIKETSEKFKFLLDKWSSRHSEGVRIDDALSDVLWERINVARRLFDGKRHEFYAERDKENKKTKQLKMQLIDEAAKIASQTEDIAKTGEALNELTEKFRKLPHLRFDEDDKLWKAFHKAQDVFYDAKKQADAKTAEEQNANLVQKQELIKELHKTIDPNSKIDNPKKAREILRSFARRLSEIGQVPHSRRREIDNEFFKVEQAINKAEEKLWKDQDPSKVERANSLTEQLNNQIADLENKIATCKDDKELKDLKEELAVKQTWAKALNK